MCDGTDCRPHDPGDAEGRVNEYHYPNYEKIQVITRPFLQSRERGREGGKEGARDRKSETETEEERRGGGVKEEGGEGGRGRGGERKKGHERGKNCNQILSPSNMYLKFVIFSIHNESCDLLVHKQ